MKRLLTLTLAGLLLGGVALAAPPKAPARPKGKAEAKPRAVPQYTIEQFLATTALAGASFSPDNGKVLVSSDQSGVFNAFAVSATGGKPTQLTRSTTDAVFAEAYFPGDERFIYTSDQGGNELDHVYVRELDGRTVDLTPGDKHKASFLGWNHDDKSFLISTNERDPRFFDIFEISAEGYQRTLLYQDTTGYDFAAISPDKRYLALGKSRTTTDSDVYLYDRETRTMKHLTPHEGEVANVPQDFSPDGQALYFLTDEGNEFQYLVRYDLATGQRKVVEKPAWDVLFASFSKRGKYLVVAINKDARTEVHLYELAGMKPVKLPAFPAGDITGITISRDETRMAFYVSGSRSPRDLFVYDFKGGAPRKLTSTLSPEIDPDVLVEAEVVRFKSFDGVEIPGVLYTPHQASPDAKVPGVVWVHGGPGDQSRVGYNGLIQYLANHGYAVYAINNRGSSGYGKTFYKMDDRKHGEGDLDDCVASKKMLAATGKVDPDRIGILGGSYGGYMVLAALTYRPEEFAAGVDLFGISNWVRTLESIPPYWESFRKALYVEMGDPSVDKEYLRGISPLFAADKIRRPLMVQQGANDPRVLKVESDEIVEAVKKNGVPVEYIVFDDEGHGFVKKENRIRGNRAVLEFLDKYLKASKQG